MKTQLIISIKVFVVLTVLCGIAYPLLVTGIAQLAFPEKANGSLIVQGNKVVGSVLIGQKFDQENYFWSRPSATDYSAMPSGGSNLGLPAKNSNNRLPNAKPNGMQAIRQHLQIQFLPKCSWPQPVGSTRTSRLKLLCCRLTGL